MKLAFALTLLLAVAAMAVDNRVDVIPGEYIVVLHKTANLASHLNRVNSFVSEVNIQHTYEIGSFKGYAVENFMAASVAALLEQPEVAYVAPNQMAYSTSCASSKSESWGLQRTSLRGNIGSDFPNIPYVHDTQKCGSSIESHVIDTGIQVEHNDFEGRATWGADFTNEGQRDGNGHGTHVASTMVGKEYGIARCSKVVAVKVLNSAGSGSFAGVIAGMDWSANVARNSGKKVVANMSLGGGANTALNQAATAAVDAGVFLVVAAGNSNTDASRFSPASADKVWTIGSTDVNDARSSFSNYGKLVNIFAPGGNIKAAWIGSNDNTRTISGTSMASPHAAGVAVRYWDANPSATIFEAQAALERSANQNMVRDPKDGPNRLLLLTCDRTYY